MPAAERPPKKPPKTATKGRVGSSQLRAAMYGDDSRPSGSATTAFSFSV